MVGHIEGMTSWVGAHRKSVIIVLIVAALLFSGYKLFVKNADNAGVYEVTTVPLTQVVNFSGTIVPRTRTDLAFERTGRVASISYDIGDTVAQGAVVASLDVSGVRADIARERAILVSEEAALAQLVRGTREEELALERARVTLDGQTLVDAKDALVTSISNGYTVSDTAIERLVDEMIDDPTTQPKVKHGTINRSLELLIENERLQLEAVLNEWRADVLTLSSGVSERVDWEAVTLVTLLSTFRSSLTANALQGAESATPTTLLEHADLARERLARMRDFLANVSDYIGDLDIKPTLTQTTIDTWRTQTAVERANVSAAIASLNGAREKYTAAENALLVAQRKLELLEVGATTEDIAAQQARVDAQEARVSALESELSKFVVQAPQTGTLVTKDINEGELATAGSTVLVIDSQGALEIDARVSELDVILLEVGMDTIITLDAYGLREEFPATITHIDPSESIVDGIAGYGLTVQFKEQDRRLRAGMTANAAVAITLKELTTAIPVGYLVREGTDTYVYVLVNGEEARADVVVGAQSDAGLVEIVSGLNEGDRVLLHDR